MSEQELCEQLDNVVESQMEYIRDRIMSMSLDQTQFDYLNALYEEYNELFKEGELDLLTLNTESGEVNEYTMCCE